VTATSSISAEFPFDSRYVEVHGSRMHYVEEGSGDPILFLHGNPTSAYLWRNIIPYLASLARCITPDLIGMGKSDKPDLAYRFFDHSRYVEGFIEALNLSNIMLVVHDWGSALGFHYARRHPANVKALAFMEAIVRPATWAEFPQDFKLGFKLMRTPGVGWFMISVMNVFVKQIMPKAIVRALTTEEKQRYAEPFPSVGSRRPVRQWPCEIPIDGSPADVHEVVSAYSQWLQETSLPKLLFHAEPGGIIREQTLEWCRRHFPYLETVNVGPGIHYLQEDNPHLIGEELAAWYRGISA
jgi:haloalkane dehalogenase